MASTTIRAMKTGEDGPAFTIPDFCAFYGFSRVFYYAMKKNGDGPEETRIGRTVRILHAARKKWEAAHTAVEAASVPAPGRDTEGKLTRSC